MIGFAHELVLQSCQKHWEVLSASLDEWRLLPFPDWIEQARRDALFASLTVPAKFAGPAKRTTIAAGSAGAALPQPTVHVVATTGFPSAGMVALETSDRGVQFVTYTGKTGTTLTGCTGGTGTMGLGGGVRAPTSAYVAFGLADLQARSPEVPPGVFVRSTGGRSDYQPAALQGSEEDVGWAYVSNTVEVVVLAQQQQVAAALAFAMNNCIFSDLENLIDDLGTDDVGFLDIADISPMRDLLPDRGNCYWTRLRWRMGSVMGMKKIAAMAHTAAGFSIHDALAKSATGRPGRVRPR